MRTGGRRIANALLLGGALVAAIVIALVVVAGGFFEPYGTEDLPSSVEERDFAGDADAPRRKRERVVRDAGPSWPSESEDPSEVAPGTPPEPIRGRVEAPGGTPLTGMSVCVGGTWVATDDDGGFDVSSLSSAPPWDVHVLAPGYRLERPVVVATRRSDSPLRLQLVEDRSVVVRGIVSGDEGRPLSDATVRVHIYRAPGTVDAFTALARSHGHAADVRAKFEPETTTLTDGTYELRVHAEARHFLVFAEAGGHVSEYSEPVHVVPGRDSYEASVALRPDRTLRGRVVDSETLLPVERATVTTWLSQQGAPGEDAVRTDANGEFAIEDAPRSNVYVLADGYLRGQLSLMPGDASLDVRLVPARVISGRVQYSDGDPVEGAYVSLKSPATLPRGVNAPRAITTDEDGTFRFDGVWDGEWTIAAVLSLYAKTNFLSTEIPRVSAGTTDVVIVVRRARAIAGRVLGPNGDVLAGVYISCEHLGGTTGSHGDVAGVYSDREGRFELRGLSQGSFTVRATVTPPGMPSYLPAEVAGVAAGAGDVELRMTLGLSVQGRVLDEEGAPVAGRRVLAIDPETVGLAYNSSRGGMTDPDGRFEISGLEDGAYRLQLKPVAPEWARCYLEDADSVRPGGGELALRLSTGGEIAGVVVDESGAPIADAEVQAVPTEHPARIESRTSTDAKGRFVLRGLIRSRRYKLHGGGATVEDVAPGATDVRIQ